MLTRSGCGGMADAQDSKSCGGDLVWVQVPPSAALRKPLFYKGFRCFKRVLSGMERALFWWFDISSDINGIHYGDFPCFQVQK